MVNSPTEDPIKTETNVPLVQTIDAEAIAAEAAKIATEAAEAKATEVATEAAEKASQQTRKDIARQISGEDEDKPWIPKNYDEIVDKAADKAKQDREEERKLMQEEADKKDEEAAKNKEKSLKSWQETWNNQINALEEADRLPKVQEDIKKKMDASETLNEEEMKDPGVVARSELYAKARELKESNLELVHYKHMGSQKQSGRPNAPVAGSSRGTSEENVGEYAYEDVHDVSFDDLISEVNKV